jgi:SnoaL-like domain
MHNDADDQMAYIAITRMQADYADIVSRRAWSELDAIFEPEAKIHLDLITQGMDFTGPGEIGSFIAGSIEQFEFFQFVILNSVVRVLDDSNATGRMYMSELRQHGASGGWSTIHGIYHDTYRKDSAGNWRFAARDYQSLARTGRSEIFPFPSSHTGPL